MTQTGGVIVSDGEEWQYGEDCKKKLSGGLPDDERLVPLTNIEAHVVVDLLYWFSRLYPEDHPLHQVTKELYQRLAGRLGI